MKFIESKKNIIKLTSLILMVIISILLLNVIAEYIQMKLNSESPFIPDFAIELYLKPKIIQGVILMIGLISSIVLKLIKKDFETLTISILTILIFYLKINNLI